MRIFYLLYFASIACLLAITIPGSWEPWTDLYRNALSFISYMYPTASGMPPSYNLVFVTDSMSAENSFSSLGGIDICWLSPFGIDGTCHPLDAPPAPTPTLVFNTSATHTLSAVAASPVVYKPVLYKDAFASQFETGGVSRMPKESGLVRGGPSNSMEPTHFLDLISSATSMMIVAQLLMVREYTFNPLLR